MNVLLEYGLNHLRQMIHDHNVDISEARFDGLRTDFAKCEVTAKIRDDIKRHLERGQGIE